MASNSFSFIWYSFLVSGHAPPVGFVSKTPPHAKSDASRKGSVSIIGGWIQFSIWLLCLHHFKSSLHHPIWDDENQSLLYKFLKL